MKLADSQQGLTPAPRNRRSICTTSKAESIWTYENEAESGARHPRRTPPVLISVRATAAYDLPDETFLLLMVEPPLVGPAHRVEQEQLLTTPTPFHELGTDVYGNPQRRIIAPKGSFSFEFTERLRPLPTLHSQMMLSNTRFGRCPPRHWSSPCRPATASRTSSPGWRAASSVNSRPVADESQRSPAGSASTSSTITGRPTPKRRRSIPRRRHRRLRDFAIW